MKEIDSGRHCWQFCEMDFVYTAYQPFSPYGKEAKLRREIYDSARDICRELDRTERFIPFVKRGGVWVKKLEHHLKELPYLEPVFAGAATSTEVFLVKKFLVNYKAVCGILPAPAKRLLGVRWELEGLLSLLSKGGDGDTFYVSSAYSAALRAVREKIAAADSSLSALRGKKQEEFLKNHSLDFRFREFVVVRESEAKKLYGLPDFFVEPYDSGHLVVRPVYGQEYLRLSAGREKLLAEEKKEEAAVLGRIAAEIRASYSSIAGYRLAAEHADVAFARARLAVDFGLSRPEFGAKGISVSGGRFLPLEHRLKNSGLKYTPLDCSLGTRLSVITGSNMGGKTVVLKTVGLLQLMAQSGFFVPAGKYRTAVFENVEYIGYGSYGAVEGLSSFGLELLSLTEAYAGKDRKSLFLLDEFARTTNSEEATALLSGVMREFGQNAKIYALFSTHCSGLRAGRETSFFRMEGFDSGAFEKYFGSDAGGSLSERLGRINRFMRYGLVPYEGRYPSRDALKVARMLGFDGGILDYARRVLEERDEK